MNNQNYNITDSDCIPQRDTETDFAEWFEDATSDADWADGLSIQGLDLNDTPNHSSMTLLDELYEKNRVLEQAWREAEQRYRNLQVENQKLNIQLSNERHRANRFQKKLQYIQDNQDIFNRLKQAYLNMKYNESVGRTMVEIREISCQTENGTPCNAICNVASGIEKQSHLIIDPSSFVVGDTQNMVTVKKADLAKLQKSVQILKDMVDLREQSWSNSTVREGQYKASISELHSRLQFLTRLLSSRYSEVFKSQDNAETIQKENNFLQKIIIKMEKRHRDMEKLYKTGRRPPLLNNHEKYTVQQLISRYSRSLDQKATRSLSCGTSHNCLFPRSPRELINVSGDMPPIGNVEGIVFNIPLPRRPVSGHLEMAEKPLSPKKKDVIEQTNSIDFSQDDVNNDQTL